MANAQYKRTLREARAELKKLYRYREEMDVKIARLRQTVVTLGALCEEGPTKEYHKHTTLYYFKSLTDVVRDVLVAASKPLTPVQIRDTLEDIGYKMESSNPLASIHSILKRLWQRGEVKVAYRAAPRDFGHVKKGEPHALPDRYYWWVAENFKGQPKGYAVIDGWAVIHGKTDKNGMPLKSKESEK